MINKLIKFLPLGSVIFITLGFLKIKFYYLSFGFDITGLVSISDIINLFIDDSISIFILLITPLYVMLNKWFPDEKNVTSEKIIRLKERKKVLEKVLKDFQKTLDKLPKNEIENSEFKDVKKGYSYKNIIISMILLSILIFMLNMKQNLTIISLYTLFVTVIPIFIINSLDNTKYEVKEYYFEILFTIGLIGIFTINIYREHFKIINNLKYDNFCIETTNETMQMKDSVLFIGNTEKYYFFRNLKNKENIIINSNEIKKITITKK